MLSPYVEQRRRRRGGTIVNTCLFRLYSFQYLLYAVHVDTSVDIFNPFPSKHSDARRSQLWRLFIRGQSRQISPLLRHTRSASADMGSAPASVVSLANL
jgi:hypothetical protein